MVTLLFFRHNHAVNVGTDAVSKYVFGIMSFKLLFGQPSPRYLHGSVQIQTGIHTILF